MVRRNTWILLVLLAALVGFAFYWRSHKAQQAALGTPTASGAAGSGPLFSAADGDATDILIKDSTGKSVEIARNADGNWVLKAPTNAPADQGSAQAAATQVTALMVLSNVQIDLNLVGLDKPTDTIAVTFSSTRKHTLSVGALTPIQDGYYTSLDNGPVRVVDKQGLDALIQLLAQPPFAVTATLPTVEAPTLAPPTVEPVGTVSQTPGTPAATTQTPQPTPTP